MTTSLAKVLSLVLTLGLFPAASLHAMGKQPDKKYSAAPRPASQTAAYNNPFTSNAPITPRTPDPARNSNAVPATLKTSDTPPAYNPYGTQTPQGSTGISQTPGNSGSPTTNGGPAAGSIGK